MSQAARYLFDLDFSAPSEPVVEEQIEEIPPEPMITVAEHERLLAEARAKAFAEGEAKARDERELMASEQRVALEKEIIEEISMVYTEVGTLMLRLERDASNLAFAFASRFAEKLVAQEPKGEIMALLNQILAPLRKTPHISIRLNDAVADDVKAAVDQQMNELGFTGTLTILPDPAIMPGDCSVEWVDGGIGRNMRSAIRQVEQLLTDHFAHVPEEPEDPEEQEASDTDDAQPEADMTDANPGDEDLSASADEAAEGQAPDAAATPASAQTEMAADDLDAEREEQ
ncbi:FliH/SctL family protein [uncultured Cohaesibacter sp.]|uniref:FliH/SctL family protein n=1 Tax=uncultured Cohaesibacter sp. TaxID=1002546 RepID=UPI0029C60026|nr:FliH/SctL family protein [uncultured Cohaesibacter sp.]